MMSNKSIKYVIEVDEKGAIKSIENFEKKVGDAGKKGSDSFTEFAKTATKALATIYAAYKSIDTLIATIELGTKLKQQEDAFRQYAASQGISSQKIIENLQKISNQTIATSDLVQASGRAMLLGLNPEDLETYMEIAIATSKLTGQTVSQAFDDITLAVGRQSKMILDNLGIIVNMEEAQKNYAIQLGKTVDELTDEEKAQAFANETKRKGLAVVKEIGVEMGDNVVGIQKMKTAWTNFSNEAAKAITQIFGPAVQGIAIAIADLLNLIANAAKRLSNLYGSLPDSIKKETDLVVLRKYQVDILKQIDKLESERISRAEKDGSNLSLIEEDRLTGLRKQAAELNKYIKTLELANVKATLEPVGAVPGVVPPPDDGKGKIDKVKEEWVNPYLELANELANEEKLIIQNHNQWKTDANNEFYTRQLEEEAAYKEKIRSINEMYLEQEREEALKKQELYENIGGYITDSFMTMYDSLISGNEKFSESFKKMAANILRDISNMIMRMMILKAVMSIMGMIGGDKPTPTVAMDPGGVTKAFHLANGGVLRNGNVIPFANGGIVTRPTIFPMAKGGTGLMGEAGPEAVMPLKRGRDGKLGVAGGGGINISNNIVIENGGQMADDPDKMNRFAAKIGEEIRNQVRSVIMDEQRVNGVLNSAAIRRYV